MNTEPTPMPPEDEEVAIDPKLEALMLAALKRKRAGISLTKRQAVLLAEVERLVRGNSKE